MYSEPSGACATPSARATASFGFISGVLPAKPVAKTSKLPEGFPFANGWNVTLQPSCGIGARFQEAMERDERAALIFLGKFQAPPGRTASRPEGQPACSNTRAKRTRRRPESADRVEDHGVPKGNRRGNRTHGEHQRNVPGSDDADDAHRNTAPLANGGVEQAITHFRIAVVPRNWIVASWRAVHSQSPGRTAEAGRRSLWPVERIRRPRGRGRHLEERPSRPETEATRWPRGHLCRARGRH
jgi:hypothetical protein